MKKTYLILSLIFFWIGLFGQAVTPRQDNYKEVQLNIPLRVVKQLIVSPGHLKSVDLMIRDQLKQDLEGGKQDSEIHSYIVLLDDGLDETVNFRSGSLPVYYPEYRIRVDLATRTQNMYYLAEEVQFTRIADSPYSYALIYRIEDGVQIQEERIVREYTLEVWFPSGRHIGPERVRMISNNDSYNTSAAYNFLNEIDNKPFLNQNEQLKFDHE